MNKLGFGFLRLPKIGDEINYEELNRMVDLFLDSGRCYFDTAYTYLNGKSEEAIRRALVERHPRERFQLASKAPGYNAKSYEDCRQYFEESCRRCGVDYFDVYMLHWLNRKNYGIAEKYDQFRFLQELKESGKAKRIGFSFHDTADLLDEILTTHPEVDCVLLQINYLDWENEGIQSRKCYETALRHGKSILAMEPIKGGTLANVTDEAKSILKRIDSALSPAAHALRFVQSLPGVETVLSGMGSLSQVQENILPIIPAKEADYALLQQVVAVLKSSTAVACTGCGYCEKHCPKQIAIPNYFKLYNEYVRNPSDDWKITPAYETITLTRGKASDCISCGLCEQNCPQKLPIREYIQSVKNVMEG